ncbi:MAG: SPOR domain-containing protein [bacterium]
MARYSKRQSSNWSFSSTALGWSITALAVLLVIVLLIGGYIGYGMGYRQGKKVAKQEFQESRKQKMGPPGEKQKQSRMTGRSGTTPVRGKDGAFSGKDLGFLGKKEEGSSTDTASREEQTSKPEKSPREKSKSTPDTIPVATGSSKKESSSVMKEMTSKPGKTPRKSKDQKDSQKSAKPTGESKAETPPLPGSDTPESYFTIQTVSSHKKKNADRAARRLRNRGHSVMVRKARVSGDTWFRVRVGVFPSRSAASKYADEMVKDGDIEDYWISKVER